MDPKEEPNITLLVVQTVFMKVMKLFSSQDVIIWSQKEKIVNKWTNLSDSLSCDTKLNISEFNLCTWTSINLQNYIEIEHT